MRKFLFLFFLISSCGLAKKSNSSGSFKSLPTPIIIENIENNKLSFTERLNQQLNLKEKDKSNEQTNKILH